MITPDGKTVSGSLRGKVEISQVLVKAGMTKIPPSGKQQFHIQVNSGEGDNIFVSVWRKGEGWTHVAHRIYSDQSLCYEESGQLRVVAYGTLVGQA